MMIRNENPQSVPLLESCLKLRTSLLPQTLLRCVFDYKPCLATVQPLSAHAGETDENEPTSTPTSIRFVTTDLSARWAREEFAQRNDALLSLDALVLASARKTKRISSSASDSQVA
jgi:hypothetical protein